MPAPSEALSWPNLHQPPPTSNNCLSGSSPADPEESHRVAQGHVSRALHTDHITGYPSPSLGLRGTSYAKIRLQDAKRKPAGYQGLEMTVIGSDPTGHETIPTGLRARVHLWNTGPRTAYAVDYPKVNPGVLQRIPGCHSPPPVQP
ncbi:hypothetical protein N7476_010725 [Penicillium atrosanguineum]|uniref:Uncharacterized protein n=1 Tax=Penicillium atrosanguineum TaxID=1132637 RepID=A0A9W9PPC3_9EURO|nr:hypothetical protein N7476_010725 [Penicillium atrosanguineum]